MSEQDLFNPDHSYRFLSLAWRFEEGTKLELPVLDKKGNIVTDAHFERKPTSELILKLFGLGEFVMLSEEQCAYLAERFAAVANPNEQQIEMAGLFKTVVANIQAEREGRRPITPRAHYHLTPLCELEQAVPDAP